MKLFQMKIVIIYIKVIEDIGVKIDFDYAFNSKHFLNLVPHT